MPSRRPCPHGGATTAEIEFCGVPLMNRPIHTTYTKLHLLAQLAGADLCGRVEVEASRYSDKFPLRLLEALDGIALRLFGRRRLGLGRPPLLVCPLNNSSGW
jgi:hypothetical protein